MEAKFGDRPGVLEANRAAFRAGWAFGETTELLDVQYRVNPATEFRSGTYRTVNGTAALSFGLIAASVRSGLPLLLASYPITPASEILHTLSRYARYGVSTIQAEDEIAAAGMALGASFGGRIGVTATSGPGMDLKAETIGLAVMLELPLVIIDVQRSGPSTGMPTKTEQSDLLMALYGRHGESPLPVIAPSDAERLLQRRVRSRVNRDPLPHAGDHPLRHLRRQFQRTVADPLVGDLPVIQPDFATAPTDGETFLPYARDERLRDPGPFPERWAFSTGSAASRRPTEPATSHMTPANHERMTKLRAAKIAGIADALVPLTVDADRGRAGARPRLGIERGCDPGQRSPRASARAIRLRPRICDTSTRCLANTGDVLSSFDHVLVPEMNTGQLAQLIRAQVPGRRDPITKSRVCRSGPRS